MSKLKISVIVPVYKAEKFLKRCLDSLVNQTLTEIEIICVNDSSPDGSLSILEEYAKIDKRFKIITQPNGGAASARNTGIREAKGEYVGFVDSDDYVDENFFEVLYLEAKRTDADIVRAAYKNWFNSSHWEYGDLTELFAERHNKGLPLSVHDHSVVIWNAIYRKDYFEEKNVFSFFEDLKASEDIPFSYMVMFTSRKTVPAVGGYYHHIIDDRDTVGSLSLKNVMATGEANRRTIEFVNELHLENLDDYFRAIKRCFIRFHNKFISALTLKDFDYNVQKAFVETFANMFRKTYNLKQFYLNYYEPYFPYLLKNDIEGYIRFSLKDKPLSRSDYLFSVKKERRHKVVRFLGLKMKLAYKFDKQEKNLLEKYAE